jgi:hypothetical protein
MKKGQSLAELALILPLLVFIMIGVFEVGHAIRNYMVLLNATREVARFSIRPDYLTVTEDEVTGYADVEAHAVDTLAGQLEYDHIVLTVFSIDVGEPYVDGEKCPDKKKKWPKCDCELVATHPYTPYVISKHVYNPDGVASQLDSGLAYALAKKQDVSNCRIKKNGLVMRPVYQVVAVEMYYEHVQLFGFPIISNPYTDPIMLRAYTIMRKMPMRHSPFSSNR